MANKKYDPYEDIKKWTYNKGLYDDAVAKGDKAGQQAATDRGMASYFNLQNNGYGDLAKRLGSTDYAGAAKIRDEYATKGKVAIRPYLYGSKLKTMYGMSDSEIDNLLSFDEKTGEVSLGGINLGSPYSNVDGTTYWDSSYLDKGLDDYISYSRITPSTGQLISQNDAGVLDKTNSLFDLQKSDHEDMNKRYGELYDYSMYSNPFETDTGKAIMADYDLKALQGRDNEVASGASANSGNIDSYAAANGLRQQAALTAKGQQMAIAAQSQRINDVRSVLGDLGGYQQNSYSGMQNTIGLQQNEAQRLFENGETEKLNDHQINYDMATVTGYIPKAWEYANNRYFNSNGTLSNPDLDYGTIIDNAMTELKTETDPTKRAKLQSELNDAIAARSYKTSPDNYGGKWSQYAKDMSGYDKTSTLERESMLNDHALSASEAEAKAYQSMIDSSVEAEKNAMDVLESYVKNGIPPTQPMLNAAGYGNYTPDEFMTAYLKNKSGIAKASKVSTGVKSAEDVVKRPTDSMYNHFVSFIDENGADGLSSEFMRYDWDKYDKGMMLDYLETRYKDDKEIQSAIKDIRSRDAVAEPTTSDSKDNNMSDIDIDAYASRLADDINGVYNADGSADGDNEGIFNPILSGANGTYKVANVAVNRVIEKIINDTSISDTDKEKLLALFGITDEQIYSYINNENYD